MGRGSEAAAPVRRSGNAESGEPAVESKARGLDFACGVGGHTQFRLPARRVKTWGLSTSLSLRRHGYAVFPSRGTGQPMPDLENLSDEELGRIVRDTPTFRAAEAAAAEALDE